MTRQELLARALTAYPFRDPDPREDPQVYVAALMTHLRQRDWAMAEEVRIGKAQADWTAADVAEFERRMLALRSDHELDPGVHVLQGLESTGHPVTEAFLSEVADEMLSALVAMRCDKPKKELPIVASVLLTTGVLHHLFPSSNDRIGVIKHLARTSPVFGFSLVFDAFMHRIVKDRTTEQSTAATKTDAILQHIGTRDRRLMRTRPYRLVGGRAVFEQPPPADINPRAEGPNTTDPYADIFVTVPSPTGAPS